MTHDLGRVVPVSQIITDASPLNLVLDPSPIGSPRFAMLHFDNVSLSGGARLEVNLGYTTDVFSSGAPSDFWTRPADAATAPIEIRIVGGSGSARLLEYGSGEPTQTVNPPGTFTGSLSNPDPFLHTNPYDEPIYETRLMCTPGFAWQNADCAPPAGISPAIKAQVENASGIIFLVHAGHVSSCSGTLIVGDLFLTSRHCLTDASGEDVRSASVTFDYAPNCDGSRPGGHAPRFFKVIEEVASGTAPGPSTVNSDWVVVRLDAAPGSLPAPIPIRTSALMAGETLLSMHHPGGSVKKTQSVVYDGDTSTINGFDFAGGSSGSGLFDAAGQLVGGPLSQGPIPGPCNVRFTPVAGIINTLENPPPPPNPLDVMLVFDKSGSMNSSAPPAGRSKLEEAQDAASLFVQLVQNSGGNRLGLVTFNHSPNLELGPTAAAAAKNTLVGNSPPFEEGLVGDIAAGGNTSIGGGLSEALSAMSGTSNDRTILLLSDGLQNTDPMVEAVEGSLGDTRLCIIGFGSDAQIDGSLLGRLAAEHGGQFTRAVDGLALRKFFGVCFGDIFQSGALNDPEHVLRASQTVSAPHTFKVCGEEEITVAIGWDEVSTPLRLHVKTPKGKSVGGKGFTEVRGRTWAFIRIPLPFRGERDGTWSFTVDRVPTGGEFPPPPTDVQYFSLVVCEGGPKMRYLGNQQRIYTGDRIDPLVGLHYPNGTVPHGTTVHVTATSPTRSLGALVQERGISKPVITGDALGGFRATLQTIEREEGALPVVADSMTFALHDDGAHDDGAMAPDGVFNLPLKDFSVVEGTYDFRATARYGDDCQSTREVMWSVHVEIGIDPEKTDVVIEGSDGKGTLVLTPRDKYGNPLGPGRPGSFEVHPIPGVSIDGRVKDRGNGSYGVDISWDADIDRPGIVVQQPDRAPGVYQPPAGAVPCDDNEDKDCFDKAEKLLDCIGLPDSDVRKIRIKSVCVEFLIDNDKEC